MMTKTILALGLAASLAVVSFVSPSAAAIVKTSTQEGCSMDLDGPIMEGDFAAVRMLGTQLGLYEPSDSGEPKNGPDDAICLNSPGGSYFEGRVISQELREAGIPTRVPDGAECYSSCAFIFMAGRLVGGEADTTARYLHINGKLGFHAPYIMPSEKKYSSQEVHSMVVQTNAVIADFIAFGSDPSAYSARPFFPVSLIAELLAAGPEEFAMVDTIEDIARWDISIYGMADKATLNDDDLRQACANFMAWEMDRPSRRLDPKWALPVVKEAGISYGKPAEWSVVNMGDMDYRGCRIKTPGASTSGLLICSRDEANGILRGDCEAGWSAYVPWYYALDPAYFFEQMDDV